MKINGKRITVYKDKLGPYDAYYYHGNIVSTVTDKYTVHRAFDLEGNHIGILSKRLRIGRFLLISAIPIICFLVYFLITYCKPKQAYCVVYSWHAPYITDSGAVALDISNLSSSDLYISVGGNTYTLQTGDTLSSVPFFASEFSILYEYEGCTYKEDIVL